MIPCHKHHQIVECWSSDDGQPSVVVIMRGVHDPNFFPKIDVLVRFTVQIQTSLRGYLLSQMSLLNYPHWNLEILPFTGVLQS